MLDFFAPGNPPARPPIVVVRDLAPGDRPKLSPLTLPIPLLFPTFSPTLHGPQSPSTPHRSTRQSTPLPPTLVVDTVIVDYSAIAIHYPRPNNPLPANDAARYISADDIVQHYIPSKTAIVHAGVLLGVRASIGDWDGPDGFGDVPMRAGEYDLQNAIGSPLGGSPLGGGYCPSVPPDLAEMFTPLDLADCVGRRVRIYKFPPAGEPGSESVGWYNDRLRVVIVGGVHPRRWARAIDDARRQIEREDVAGREAADARAAELSALSDQDWAAAVRAGREAAQLEAKACPLGRTPRFARALVARGLGCEGRYSAAIRDGCENSLVRWVAEEVAVWEMADQATRATGWACGGLGLGEAAQRGFNLSDAPAQPHWVALTAVVRGSMGADCEVRERCGRVLERVARGW